MTDFDFLTAFEQCTLPKTEFRHRGHLRICWMYLSQHPFELACQKVCEGILRFAKSLGAEHIFHTTLTLTWVHLLANAIKHTQVVAAFDDFLAANEYLLNKDLPKDYYSESRLQSLAAKQMWLEPDLKSFQA